MPFVYNYFGVIMQPHLGKIEYWQHILDYIDEVVWRSYKFTEPWAKDDDEMVYLFCPRYFLGRVPAMIKRFCLRWVVR